MKVQNKSLGINAFLNVIRSSLSVVFPLITYPYAFRTLHAENMGKIDFSNSIISYFSLIAVLGVSSYAVREGAKVRDDKEKIDKLSSEILNNPGQNPSPVRRMEITNPFCWKSRFR